VDLTTIAVGLLVAIGVVVELACCAGVVVMRDVYDKLHFTGPATILGPLALAGAIVVQEGLNQAGIKALLVAGLLLVANPVLTHATGRALYIRQRDHLEPASEDAPK
jgi:monovalent cation/proton antiporter MnhG/PhaG subunit